MISDKKIQALILEAMKNVKQSDAVYKDWLLNERTIVLGNKSPMDSIAFTAFVVALEEKIEEEIKREYTLNLDEIYGEIDAAEISLSVDEMARRIAHLLG